MDPSGKGKKRRSYTLDFKLKVVKEAAETSGEKAAKKYNVNPRRIREWKTQRNALSKVLEGASSSATGTTEETEQPSTSAGSSTTSSSSCKSSKKKRRLEGGGRKVQHVELETMLYSWLSEQRDQGLAVSMKAALREAKRTSLQLDPESLFAGSPNWWYGFCNRHALTMRLRTTVGQKLPEAYQMQLLNFFDKVRQYRLTTSMPISNIVAADETAVWFYMPATRTVEKIGAKSVHVKTTGREKSRVTVMLAACGDGRKLKPTLIFKGKGTRSNLKVTGLNIMWSDSGWITEELSVKWLRMTLGRFGEGQRMLVWDTYAAHMTAAVESEARACKVSQVFIPGGCTGLVQAPDVVWNKPFKVLLELLRLMAKEAVMV